VRTPSPARKLYLWTVFTALPGMLWAAYEMYWLTLHGPQMLFFSISHGAVIILMLVLPGALMAVPWVGQSMAALVSARYARRIAIPLAVHSTFIVAVGGHAILLATYQRWSTSDRRVWICIVGFILICSILYGVVRYVVAGTSEIVKYRVPPDNPRRAV
jgi:hypothetical protein